MTEHEKIDATVGWFYRQAKEDAAHSNWFWKRLGEVARQAQAERRRQRRVSKGAKKK